MTLARDELGTVVLVNADEVDTLRQIVGFVSVEQYGSPASMEGEIGILQGVRYVVERTPLRSRLRELAKQGRLRARREEMWRVVSASYSLRGR